MNWLIDKLAGLIGINAVAWLSVVLLLVFGALCGWRTASRLSAVQAEFSAAREKWEEERREATDKALKESEEHRARGRDFTEKLSAAAKEHDDAKTRLAALRTDRERVDRQLRDARSAITAALNRQQQPAAPACHRAADAALTALGGCAEAYRGMAHRYGECLAGMQMIEKTWDAARAMYR